MTVRKSFKCLHRFSAALAAGVLLAYAAGVSAAPVQAPPLPHNAGAKVKIQAGEPLDKAGYAKKAKPPKVKPKAKQNPNNPGQNPSNPGAKP